jgi:hypothetical protein
VPDHWLVTKTISVLKNKSKPQNIESYRPMANLCFTSKIFEKLILKSEIQKLNKVDITRQSQHSFKEKRSSSPLATEF